MHCHFNNSLKSAGSANLMEKNKKVGHTKTICCYLNLKIASCFLYELPNEPLPSCVGMKGEGELGISTGKCGHVEKLTGWWFGF